MHKPWSEPFPDGVSLELVRKGFGGFFAFNLVPNFVPNHIPFQRKSLKTIGFWFGTRFGTKFDKRKTYPETFPSGLSLVVALAQ